MTLRKLGSWAGSPKITVVLQTTAMLCMMREREGLHTRWWGCGRTLDGARVQRNERQLWISNHAITQTLVMVCDQNQLYQILSIEVVCTRNGVNTLKEKRKSKI